MNMLIAVTLLGLIGLIFIRRGLESDTAYPEEVEQVVEEDFTPYPDDPERPYTWD